MIALKDRLYLGTIATLLLIILVMRMCSSKPAPCPAGKLIKSDTVWVGHLDSSGWIRPIPTAIIPARVIHDTLEITSTQWRDRPVDSLAILKDYFATRVYKDTAATEYGNIYLEDSISQNRIKARRWKTDLRMPTVTNTVQDPAPARLQVYGGFSLSGNETSLLYGFGPELLLKTKNDKVYGIGAQLTQGGEIYYSGKMYFKINLHKH